MNLQEAIDAPAFHTDHFPSSFYPRGVAAAVAVGRVAGGRGRSPSCGAAGTTSTSGRLVAGPGQRGAPVDGGFLYAGANPRGMQGYAAGR